MIRATQGLCFVRRSCTVCKQRVMCIPKQFSILADEEKKSETIQPILSPVVVTEKTSPNYVESFKEIKYSFLKQVFNGPAKSGREEQERERCIKNFLNSLSGYKPPEIMKVLQFFVDTNNRPYESIKTLCSVLASNMYWKYTTQDCSDLLYLLARLSFKDHSLIKLIVSQAKSSDHFRSPKLAACMAHSLSELRYRDSEFLEKLFKFVVSDTHNIKTSVKCLKAASVLNYTSPEVETLLKILSPLKETDFEETIDYVNFVWSSVLLDKTNCINIEHITTILSEDFIARVIYHGVNPTIKWKLLNINGGAKYIKSYKGPLVENSKQFKNMTLTVLRQKTTFFDSVWDTLSHITAKDMLVKPFTRFGAGFYLDFELCEMKKKPEGSQNSKMKNRVGIMLLHFNDICSDGALTGIAHFKIRLLKNMGFKVVLLRYSEYNQQDPLIFKMQCILKKIKEEAVNGEDECLLRFVDNALSESIKK